MTGLPWSWARCTVAALASHARVSAFTNSHAPAGEDTNKTPARGMVSSTTRSAIAMLSLAACGSAAALGFGEYRAQALLGQPLNLALPVSLSEGETLTSECASAEVMAGDVKLQPGTVRVRVTQGRENGEVVIRIATTVPIDEPVVNIAVGAGCPTRITRNLVLFADPPLIATAVTVAAASEPSGTPPRAAAPAASAAAATTIAAPPARATRPTPPSRATRLAQPRTPRSVAPATAPPPDAAAATGTATTSPATPPRSAGRPRLELDTGRIATTSSNAAAQAAQAQASAAQLAAAQAEAAASAARQRMQEMEAEVTQLREQAKAQSDALVQLRQQIAQNQVQGRQDSRLLPALLAVAGVLAAITIWLGWRGRRRPVQPAHDVWWDKTGAGRTPGDESSFKTSTYRPTMQPSSQVPLASAPVPLSMRAGLDDTVVEDHDPRLSPPTVAMSRVSATPLVSDDVSSRAVSVDEQIDLEQQADFFIALGHDESAIDLLMAHLRSTGGGTPLPFLKLLDIHRRRNDREAYERTRVRFNQRFNSVAPDWTSDPKAGRSLEDYPLVVGRIQHVWPKPLDAMAELESFLFRRGAGSDMFDLPAYQEVLFLYQLARDLHQAEQPDDKSDVDVLLPIGVAAAPVPQGTIVLRPEFSGGQALSLDLDLTTKTGSIDTGPAPILELELEFDPKAAPGKAGPGDAWIDDPDDRRRK
jgi:pilus assembly protein FimV